MSLNQEIAALLVSLQEADTEMERLEKEKSVAREKRNSVRHDIIERLKKGGTLGNRLDDFIFVRAGGNELIGGKYKRLEKRLAGRIGEPILLVEESERDTFLGHRDRWGSDIEKEYRVGILEDDALVVSFEDHEDCSLPTGRHAVVKSDSFVIRNQNLTSGLIHPFGLSLIDETEEPLLANVSTTYRIFVGLDEILKYFKSGILSSNSYIIEFGLACRELGVDLDLPEVKEYEEALVKKLLNEVLEREADIQKSGELTNQQKDQQQQALLCLVRLGCLSDGTLNIAFLCEKYEVNAS